MGKNGNKPVEEAERSRQGGALTRRSTLASIALLPWFAQTCESHDHGTPPPLSDASEKQSYATRVRQFVDAYNSHDIEQALSFFAKNAVLTLNEGSLVLGGQAEIRAFLAEYGADDEGAPLIVTGMVNDVSLLTGDGFMFQGRIFYRSRQEVVSGYPSNGLAVSVAFAFRCRFDDQARCTSCSASYDFGPLLPSPPRA